MSAAAAPDERPVAIRPARASDAAGIAVLLGELGYPTHGEQVATRLAAMDVSRDVVIVATVGDDVVGTASLHLVPQLHRSAPMANVATVVVREPMRGRGIGQRLMRALEAEAVVMGSDRIELVSRATRESAHRLYLRLGYEETSHRTYRFVRSLEPDPPR